MNTTSQPIPYRQTGFFSKTLTDYIDADIALQPFYKHAVSIDGIKAAIAARKNFNTDRRLLVSELKKQYQYVATNEKVNNNLDKLRAENTFTITTAHQPNIFTGHLYFIYKILHAVKLAEYLQAELPENNFVPVYYMGSEDADLDELNNVTINGQKYIWQTKQTGAVGRMKVDKALLQMIKEIEGQVLVQQFGSEILQKLKTAYKEGNTIEQATFTLVNELFQLYGLVVLLPDNAALKSAFAPVLEKEIHEKFSHKAVTETVAKFPKEYKVQAAGRDINLFWLGETSRERIVEKDGKFVVQNADVSFTINETSEVLKNSAQNFSPNVILRPVFQEMILPNVAFIGGGGELAYWLELKKVFEEVAVPYPMLIVRNSFLLVEEQFNKLAAKLSLSQSQLFKSETDLINDLVKKQSHTSLSLNDEIAELKKLYGSMQQAANAVDKTLAQHTAALQTQAIKKIEVLEKKMLRAEKRKFSEQQVQISKLRSSLFPKNNLQERTENFISFYAKYGKEFINEIYKNSLSLQQQFTIVEIH
jgi:bacillithiol synthase